MITSPQALASGTIDVYVAGVTALGVQLKRWFATPRGQRVFNRSCSVLLGGAGLGLLLARR